MFRHKVPAIKVARDRLLDLPVEQARTGALVLGGLRRACELADTLDSCITEDMTFARACLQTSYRSQISEAARHTKAAKTSASLS